MCRDADSAAGPAGRAEVPGSNRVDFPAPGELVAADDSTGFDKRDGLEVRLGALDERKAIFHCNKEGRGAEHGGDDGHRFAVNSRFGGRYEDAAGLVGVAGLDADDVAGTKQEINVFDVTGDGQTAGGWLADDLCEHRILHGDFCRA